MLAVAIAMVVRRLRHLGEARGSRRPLWAALVLLLGFLASFLALLEIGLVNSNVANFVLFLVVLLYGVVQMGRIFGQLDVHVRP
jgi:drug/metabolite transporter (DMT)-like permease